MKNLKLLNVLCAMLIFIAPAVLNAAPTVSFYTNAEIVGIDGCCYSVRVDLHMVTTGDGEINRDIVLASSTTNLGEEGCCPGEGDGVVFEDLPGFDKSISALYGVDLEITAMIDESLSGVLSSNKKEANEININDVSVSFYPNPVRKGIVYMEFIGFSPDRYTVKMYDENARLLRVYKEKEYKNERIEITVFGEKQGVYFIHVETNEKTIVKKIIIEQR